MLDVETSLKALVLGHPDIAAAFGQRYYIDHIPNDVTYPLLRAQTVTDADQDSHSNTWGKRALIQLDVWDDDKATCNVSAELVRRWLHRYRGAFGDGDATIKIRNAPSIPDPDTKLFRRILEVEILVTV